MKKHRRGRRMFKWAAGAAFLVLIVALLPYASALIGFALPNLSNRAVTVSQVLSQRFEESARLETMQIEEEGVLKSSTSALFLGTVQDVTIEYLYKASMGIDLQKVAFQAEGNVLTLFLPDMEVLADSLTPVSIDRKDFWYPLTDAQRETLLQKELVACRTRHLDEQTASETSWEQTCRMLDATIAQWLDSTFGLVINYERAVTPTLNAPSANAEG